MSALSNYLESGYLNHTFRSATLSKPSTIAIALTSTPPDDTQVYNEISGGSYARVNVGAPSDSTWDYVTQVSDSGLVQNTSTITFPTATADWGYVSGVIIFDAATGGNVLFRGAVPTPRDVKINDVFTFSAGNLKVYMS